MNRNQRLFAPLGLALLSVILAACEEPTASPAAEVDASLSADAAAVSIDAGCLETSLMSCACSAGGAGTRTCRSGEFGPCEGCTSSPVSDSRCVAGRYQGTFLMSNYRSGPGGFCGFTAEGKENVAQGKWDFTLSQSGTLEFFTVAGGCLSAGEAGGTPPLKATLSGSVDCVTGKLTGTLKGTYRSTSVCRLGQGEEDTFFKGSMSGTFDPKTLSFVDTEVQWAEPPVLIPPQPGGSGTWQATLAPAAEAPSDVDCLGGVVFPEDKFPGSP